jgi:hypothetical protein
MDTGCGLKEQFEEFVHDGVHGALHWTESLPPEEAEKLLEDARKALEKAIEDFQHGIAICALWALLVKACGESELPAGSGLLQ